MAKHKKEKKEHKKKDRKKRSRRSSSSDSDSDSSSDGGTYNMDERTKQAANRAEVLGRSRMWQVVGSSDEEDSGAEQKTKVSICSVLG